MFANKIDSRFQRDTKNYSQALTMTNFCDLCVPSRFNGNISFAVKKKTQAER